MPYLKLFPREQIMFVRSEDFYTKTEWHMENISRFLGLQPFDWSGVVLKKFNFVERNAILETTNEAVRHPPLTPDLRKKIFDFIKPFNNRLEELIGFSWGRPGDRDDSFDDGVQKMIIS